MKRLVARLYVYTRAERVSRFGSIGQEGKEMGMRRMRVLVAVLVLAVASQGSGRTIVVPQDYASIQAASDAGANGDTIIVQPGTYEESIVFGGKNLTVR